MDINSVKEIKNGFLVNGIHHVPNEPANRHYQMVQEWIGEGNTPTPADPILEPIIVVSPRQIRQALTAAGIRTDVENAVAAGSQDLKDWWEFSTAFEENHPMVIGMAEQLGVANNLHALFESATLL